MLISTHNTSFKNLLNYPNLGIEPEQITFICGDSGSGKSTLLKLLNGSVSPQTGEICFNDNNINKLDSVDLRKEVLLVSQSVYLFDMKIKENFQEFYRYRNLTMPSDNDIKMYLKLCCADFPLEMCCTTMSGGERQRVYIAIFLSFRPKVLMLDEPTSALDSQNATAMMQNLVSFCKCNHITMIVVSHDKTLASQFAEKVVYLERDG